MTSEREKEIREVLKAVPSEHPYAIAQKELLAEIDRLRTPVVAITDSPIIQENITIDTRYKFECEIRELKAEIDRLRELVDAFQYSIDFTSKNYEMLEAERDELKDNLAVAERHLVNITKIGNYTAQGEAEEALSKIRGEK